MFGINPAEFIVLLVVAAVVLGPERLPQYAQQLARLVQELRRMAQGASRQVREEIGPEFDDIDWRKLDPRQYDPRRIVREALADTWDPDDPLGLKENGYTEKDLRGEGSRSTSNGSRPRAAGSNGRGSGSAAAGAAGSGGSAGAGKTSDSPASETTDRTAAFDPDAT